jgi:hypothetical protein
VLIAFLQANVDAFTWELSQMPGIPREVIEHHLKIHTDARPVRQKPRKQSIERQNFIHEEVHKLLQARFIEEVYHPVWLANPVIVPKANGKLWMCIDYTNLNKAYRKNPYPLPRIDQIVDSTSLCDLLSFIDVYSGFHQIKMTRDDRKHTAFVTVDGLYCYTVMPYVSAFNRLPTEGYTQGGKFWVRRRRDQELEGERNTKFRQVRAARCVTPYVLYGDLY